MPPILVQLFVTSVLTCVSMPLALAASAASGVENNIFTEEEIDERVIERRRERAATYRLTRARVAPTLPASYHAQAEDARREIANILQEGDLNRACERAEDALERWPFADSAASIQHLLLRCYMGAANIGLTHGALVDLWERHPDYAGIQEALSEALAVAEYSQNAAAAIDLDAINPDEVIREDAVGGNRLTNRLFRFLANNGSPVDVSPRASLGLARAMLFVAAENRDYLIVARQTYDVFLQEYPDHPLLFDALSEQALTFLIAHRGERFDGGILDMAEAIIAQASAYIDNLPDRARRISEYRNLILRWRQAHDLGVARWYAKEDHIDAARRSYQSVIDRGGDPDSSVVRDAQRELAELTDDE